MEGDEEDDKYGQKECPNEDLEPHSSPEQYAFNNDDAREDANEDAMSGRLDEATEADIMDEITNEDNVMAVVDCKVDDESMKRKEHRQAQAGQNREGDRCRKEGLRRNYLMVDDHTHKPYGPGVREWRKEIMLLSRILDPAIGNINRQPDSAVYEIAKGIQHTWEYSS